MDYAPSHLYGHTVVKVLSFLLILPNALYERRLPGSREALLPPRPLRTARKTFALCSSSLSNASFKTRLCNV